MRYVVGYGSNQLGIDGISLASTLARSSGATLSLVTVLPDDAPSFHIYSPDRAFNEELADQGREWLEDGLSRIPEDLASEGHLRRAGSITAGLIAEATDPERGAEADLIVVGTSKRVKVGRLGLGSLADALLHASPVPVALAPVGYVAQPRITRVTCATGTRPGAEELLEVAIRSAAAWRVPLRLMSLVAVGEDGSDERRREWVGHAERHVRELTGKVVGRLPAECPVDSVVGSGGSLKEAVGGLDFSAGEVVMVGSSRLAQSKRLFLGQTASKIMRALPVPMIVVPRDYELPAA